MKATISGQAGFAVVEDGAATLLYSVDAPDGPISVSPDTAVSLFREATDIFVMVAWDREDAQAQLKRAWQRDRLLQMILILFRRDTAPDLRRMAAEAAEELLKSHDAEAFVLNRLYSSPLPEEADLAGALEMCGDCLPLLRLLLAGLQADGRAITELWEAWSAVTRELGRVEVATLRRRMEQIGLFHALVVMNHRSLYAVIESALFRDPVLSGSPAFTHVLQLLAKARPYERVGLQDRLDQSLASERPVRPNDERLRRPT